MLIVGGGVNQASLVDEARRRGFTTVVTDINPDPPAKVLADFFYQIDTTNESENLKIAKLHQVDAVITDQSDAAVPTASLVAERLELPGLDRQTAKLFTNKFLMRTALHGRLPQFSPSHFASFSDRPSALSHVLKLGGDLARTVVKPIDSQGSKGVSRLSTLSLERQIAEAFNESRSGTIIFEEFVAGTEYCIDSVVLNGTVTCLAIGRKEHFKNNECLDQRIIFDVAFIDEFGDSLVDANRQIVSALGLHTGLVHAEFIANGSRILLVEVAARGGGAGIANIIVPRISGFNTTSFLLDFATGLLPLEVEVSPPRSRSAILHFFEPDSDRIKSVRVGTRARELSLDLRLNAATMDSWSNPSDSRNRLGYFIVSGDDYQEACEREAAVLADVCFEYEFK